MIPFLGRYLVFIVLAGMLLGFINAANGRREELPIVGKLATGEMKPKDIWNQAKPYMDKLVHIFTQLFKKPDHPVQKNATDTAAPGKPAATPTTPTQPATPVAPTVIASDPSAPPPASPLDNSTPKP